MVWTFLTLSSFLLQGRPLQNIEFFELGKRNETINFRERPKSWFPKTRTFSESPKQPKLTERKLAKKSTEITCFFFFALTETSGKKQCVLDGFGLITKYVDLKSGHRIDLACSGAEKNNFLCFEH